MSAQEQHFNQLVDQLQQSSASLRTQTNLAHVLYLALAPALAPTMAPTMAPVLAPGLTPTPVTNRQTSTTVTTTSNPQQITQPPAFTQPTFQFTGPPLSNGTPLTPDDLLRYWPWVDTAHLSAISHSTFEINNFPKLLRDEGARRKHINHSINGILTDLNIGKQKVLTRESKLLSSFPNVQAFISAFTVFASLRTAYDKDYAPPLHGVDGTNHIPRHLRTLAKCPQIRSQFLSYTPKRHPQRVAPMGRSSTIGPLHTCNCKSSCT